jgi:AcrR family transcriptional regulator
MKSKQKLQAAASELFMKKGYENTTVQEIASAAGLTERTFFRQFKDKSDVLFDSENHLGNTVAVYIKENFDVEKNPLKLVVDGFASVDLFNGSRVRTITRSKIIASNPDLRERELLKTETLKHSIIAAFAECGTSNAVDKSLYELVAAVAIAIFHLAFQKFIADETKTFAEQMFAVYMIYEQLKNA